MDKNLALELLELSEENIREAKEYFSSAEQQMEADTIIASIRYLLNEIEDKTHE